MGPDSRLRGIVFDLDGTLYDKRPLERFVMRRFWYGLHHLLRYRNVRTSLAGEEHGDYESITRAALQRLSTRPAVQQRWLRWIREQYDPTVLEGMRTVARPYPGAGALLESLRARGFRLGLVSDYVGVEDRLTALGLSPALFDFCLETERVGAMKPAAGAVTRMLEGMALPGADLLMVGDRAFADQRFAETAGMRFLGVQVGKKSGGKKSGKKSAAQAGDWRPWSGVVARLEQLDPA